MKVDTSNTDPAYWERVLAGRKSTTNDRDFEDLRKQLDGDDAFMRGHQIVKVRVHERETPEWTSSIKTVRELVQRSFPKMATSESQRKFAKRWLKVIQLFYRMGLSQTYVAHEMRLPIDVVKDTLRSIQRASRGIRADNKPRALPPSGQPT
jgi:hypothetical protein